MIANFLIRIAALSCLACLAFVQSAIASTREFDVVARVDSAFLRIPQQDALVPDGALLKGRFTLSDPPSQQFGGDYLYDPGLEVFEISTEAGFSLQLDNRVVSVATGGGTDFLTVQSFVSEDPNGWNMFMDLSAIGWRNGDTTLPTFFPDTFESAFISAYFLDEFDTIQSIDATVLSVSPSVATTPVPSPSSGLLMAGGVLMGLVFARNRRRPI